MQFEGEGEGEDDSPCSSSSMSTWHSRAGTDGEGDEHRFNININININVDDNCNEMAEAETKEGCTDFSHVGVDSGKSCGQMLCFDGVKEGYPIGRNGEQVREEINEGFPKDWRNSSQSEVGVFSMKKRNNCEAFGDDSNVSDMGSQLETGRELEGRNVRENLKFVHQRFNKLESGHTGEQSKETEVVKEDGLRSGPSSERKEIDLELANDDCAETAKHMGSQELTLSYMCDKSKPSFKTDTQAALRGSYVGPEQGGEKGKDKGKQSALSLSNGTEPAEYSGRWLERDFLHLRASREEQRSCKIEKGLSSRHLLRGEEALQLESRTEGKRQKKLKTDCFQLSLGLPDVSLNSASSDLNVLPPLPALTRSIQSLGHTNYTRTSSLGHTNYTRTSSLGHTNHTRTSSDGFTTSLEYSQSHTHVHYPSCSLTQNSLENNEYSVGSQPESQRNDQTSYGNWQNTNASEQVSHRNHGSMGQAQERSKSGRDISLYQKVLQNGNLQVQPASQGSFGGNNRERNFARNERADSHSQGSYHKALQQKIRTLDGSQGENDGNERQFSFPREIREQSRRDVRSSPSLSVSSQETRSAQQKRIGKNMSTPEANRDILFPGNKQVTDGERPAIRDILTADRIIREIVLEPINIMAQKLQELPGSILDDAREYLQDLMENNEKRDHFANFQKSLQRRSDLTSDMLIKSHRFQLEILVTLKTGIKTFLRCNPIPNSELVDIFLDFRCRNLACKSQLPVDDCECKVCSQRSGFCSSCMCLICSKFDCAFNTCSWVGCDMCLHWCHTDCGIRESYIKPSPSIKGAPGTTEMQFHCIACGHFSEMFGFVKDVFKRFAKEWVGEILVKELDFVRRIFQESEDPRGKQLCRKAEDMLVKLESKVYGSSEVCNVLLTFFTECDSKFSEANFATAKEPVLPSEREGPHKQLAVAVREAIYNINYRSSEKVTSKILKACETSDRDHVGKKIDSGDKILKACETSDRDHVGKKKDSRDLHFFDRERNKAELDELDSIVRCKQAEAQMFQSRADDARREALGLQRIALAKSNMIEEEYSGKLAKLCLTETEERRRLKLQELHNLEIAHRNYYTMKIRMEKDIKDLLIKMETTQRQFL